MTRMESSKWTGPPDDGVESRRGAFTHRFGDPTFTSDHVRLYEAQRRAALIPPEWVKVLDRSRAPGRGQLAWPILREQCFSDEPLSSLPR